MTSTPAPETAPLLVETVTVGPRRVRARVRVPAGAPTRTSAAPAVAAAVEALLPGVRRHLCRCGSPHGIAAELADTETPHLLEHVALELMALSGSPRTLSGETRWDFAADGPGVFFVELDYDDDVVALAALREATTVVSALLAGEAVPETVERAVARLEQLR